MKDMTEHLTSNLFNAVGIAPDVRIETKIVSIRERDFEDGTTKPVVYTDYLGKGIVLNQTRLKAGIAAWGPNPDNWIGKSIIISRGPTIFKGEPTWAVVMEPVVADKIAAHGATVTAISNRREPSEPSLAPTPPEPGEIDDDIPF
jgi:hypothetical protein